MIEVLQSEQPLAAKDLAEALNISKNTLLPWLRRLLGLDLVKKIKFEQHVLYCSNGAYQTLIDTFFQDESC